MQKLPLVSTLICTYNAEKFISMTLDSVVSQTYKNQEILILDNGSKDQTLDILRQYALQDNRIKIFDEGKNIGSYAGLNYLLDRAKGEYIAIQDHDDIRHSEKIQKQVDFLERHTQYIGSGTGTLMYYGKSKVGFVYDTKPRDTTKVIHTSLVFRNQGFRYNASNDFLCDGYFMQNILSKGKNIIHVQPEVLTLHYYKETGTNYSEQWFKLKKKNIKRYFDVYGYHRYFIFLFIYLLFCKVLPQKIKSNFDFMLLCWIKGAKSKKELENDTIFLKEMLNYYN